MSKKKRSLEKQKKLNSPARKAKQAKKQKYASWESKQKWKDKQDKKHQEQINKRVSQGVAVDCPLQSWEKPSDEKCRGCDRKCFFRN